MNSSRSWMLAPLSALFVSMFAGAVGLTLVLWSNAEADDRPRHGPTGEKGDLDAILESWPAKAREAAVKMIRQYGTPGGITSEMLVWDYNGPWKRTIVYKEETPHNFPVPHKDVVEQFVSFRVPLDRFDELAKFDGSVIGERTKGELSARCGEEAMNFLALNLAAEVASGKTTVKAARKRYGEEARAFMEGKGSTYVQGLLFEVDGGAADPDVPLEGMDLER